MAPKAAKAAAKAKPAAAPKAKAAGPKAKAAAPRGPRQSPKSHWCWTLNNPTALELKALWCINQKNGGPLPDEIVVQYVVIGAEHWDPRIDGAPRGPTAAGTPHLQGYTEFKEYKCRVSTLKGWFGNRVHFEPRYGTPVEAAEYCKKDGIFRERGSLSWKQTNAMRKNNAHEFIAHCIHLIQTSPTWMDVLLNPEISAYVSNKMQWAKQIYDGRPRYIKELNTAAPGYRWQARFQLFLTCTAPDDRTVIYVYNPDGNIGKTRFVTFMCAKYGHMMGQNNDAKSNASLWEGQKVVFFDIPRSKPNVDWACVESLKNGMLVQTKYDVIIKVYPSPHLVMFSNAMPDFNQLSADRWLFIDDLSDDITFHEFFPPDRFPEAALLRDPFIRDGGNIPTIHDSPGVPSPPRHRARHAIPLPWPVDTPRDEPAVPPVVLFADEPTYRDADGDLITPGQSSRPSHLAPGPHAAHAQATRPADPAPVYDDEGHPIMLVEAHHFCEEEEVEEEDPFGHMDLGMDDAF